MKNEALGVSIQYVGLDVHKDSIDVATADEGRGAEVRHVGKIGGDLAALDKALRRLISRGCSLRVVYEAGPCGFVIARHLAAQGIDCMVVAPSSIPWRPGNRVKTDRRDALMLARLARVDELTPVRKVPRWTSGTPSHATQAVSPAPVRSRSYVCTPGNGGSQGSLRRVHSS